MRLSFAALILAILCGLAVLGLARADSYLPIIGKPDVTPTPTETVTSTRTPVTSGTATPIPTITPTAPTPTFTPTRTPIPTYTAGPSPTPTISPTGSVTVRKSTDFITNDDTLYIVGEAFNQSLGIANFVRITVLFGDSNGDSSSVIYPVELADLPWGAASPFVLTPPIDLFNRYGVYRLFATWTNPVSPPIPVPLQVLQPESYFGDANAFHAKGFVRNQTDVRRQKVKIAVIMYDSTGTVIGASAAYSSPSTLNADQQTPFDLQVPIWKGMPDRTQVSSYAITVFDNQRR